MTHMPNTHPFQSTVYVEERPVDTLRSVIRLSASSEVANILDIFDNHSFPFPEMLLPGNVQHNRRLLAYAPRQTDASRRRVREALLNVCDLQRWWIRDDLKKLLSTQRVLQDIAPYDRGPGHDVHEAMDRLSTARFVDWWKSTNEHPSDTWQSSKSFDPLD